MHPHPGPIQGPVSIAQDAQDCRALLGALDVRQAHVVGHSYGTLVAVRLAVDAPEVVSSLALFDPSPLVVTDPDQFFRALRPIMDPIMDKYRAGDARIGQMRGARAAGSDPSRPTDELAGFSSVAVVESAGAVRSGVGLPVPTATAPAARTAIPPRR